MKVEFIYPKSELLKKHIEFFYFFRPQEEVDFEWTAFPTTRIIISIYRDTELIFDQNPYFTRQIKSKTKTYLIGRYLHPLTCRYNGYFDEIAVSFTPLGLPYFFPQNYSDAAPNDIQEFRPDYPDWDEFINNLYELSEIEARAELLESYFLSKYKDAKLEKYQPIVEYLLDVEENLTIKKIAENTGFSQKTIERIWRRHIGCSPATFRRISRFRHLVELYLKENPDVNLIELSYRSNFFDQSYLNKEFRRLANLPPKKFFNSIWKSPKNNAVWKIF